MNDKAFARSGVLPGLPSLEAVAWMTSTLDDLDQTFRAFYPQTNLDAEGGDPRGFLMRDCGIPLDRSIRMGLAALQRMLQLEAEPELNHKLCRGFKHAREALNIIQYRELQVIHRYWVEEYAASYDPNLLSRIEAGRSCTPKQADRAAAIQQGVQACFAEFFGGFDYLVVPISPQPSPDKADWSKRLEEDLVHLNAPVSLAHLPSLILPFACEDGRHSAAQVVIHPARLRLVPNILKEVRALYTV